LGRSRWPASDPRVQRAVRFLQKDQHPDGPWYGRWGVNYIYGTSGALRAMESVGLQKNEECQRAVAWLRSVQNSDGGFGETCGSYDDPKLMGQGPSTPSQTAWGLIGLLAAGKITESAVKQSVSYLLDQQRDDGTWSEAFFTGTGFPRVFYLRYHLYRNVFPLYALARYRNMQCAVPDLDVIRFSPLQFPSRNGSRKSH